jgi:dienelactone hydrolase
VYRAGTGPAVIVIHEIPGIHPGMLTFAQRLLAAGYTVYLPSLFGRPGEPFGAGPLLRSVLRVCVSREFAILADRTSPVVTWLRALAAKAYRDCGGPGVGAIGMCLTGGFALAMAVEPAVLAPVVSQPGLPAPLTARSAPRSAWMPPTWLRSRRAPAVGCPCWGCGFPPIGAVRPSGSRRCAASWAAPSRGSRSTPHPAILTPSPPGRMRY